VATLLVASGAAAKLPSVIDLSQTQADVMILGANAYQYTGSELACGDYNGDGLLDVALLSMGPQGTNPYPFFHVFWGGSPLPKAIDLATHAESVSYVRGMVPDDGFWSHIASGDFNGDQVDDIALGVACTGSSCAGKVYIIFGTVEFPDTLDLRVPTIGIATANHCAFYLMSGSTVADHAEELQKYDTSKGTIRFAADKPLPATLVLKLVKARMAENGK
jgi:hypothetical protein